MAKNGCSEFFLTKKKKKEDWLKFGMAKIFSQKTGTSFFWKKLSEKIWNGHFWPFQIYTSLFGKNRWKKFRTAILAILNLCQSFWVKLSEKIRNVHFWPFQIYTSLFGKNCWKNFGIAIFGHSKFIAVFLGKIVGKNSKQPFLAILNLCQYFWVKLSGKI